MPTSKVQCPKSKLRQLDLGHWTLDDEIKCSFRAGGKTVMFAPPRKIPTLIDFILCMIPHPAEYVNRRGFPHGGGNNTSLYSRTYTEGSNHFDPFQSARQCRFYLPSKNIIIRDSRPVTPSAAEGTAGRHQNCRGFFKPQRTQRSQTTAEVCSLGQGTVEVGAEVGLFF